MRRQELGLADHVGFIRNNVDHYSGVTFGCHENYLVRGSAPLTNLAKKETERLERCLRGIR